MNKHQTTYRLHTITSQTGIDRITWISIEDQYDPAWLSITMQTIHPDIHPIETAKALIDTWISSCDDIEKKHPKNTVTD